MIVLRAIERASDLFMVAAFAAVAVAAAFSWQLTMPLVMAGFVLDWTGHHDGAMIVLLLAVVVSSVGVGAVVGKSGAVDALRAKARRQ